MKQFIKSFMLVHWIATTSIYLLYYTIKTFIIWKFTNPFQWFIDIPSYTPDYRGNIIGFLFIYEIFILSITIPVNHKLNEKP